MVLAEAAQRSLDVQYYIWHDDLTGRLFADALLRAADRGVRVRVLVDDVGTKANDETLLTLDAHPNIEIRLFNPVASRIFRGLGMLSDFSRTNRRMHNKAFVADNQRAILGGRNIGDEYFEAHGDVAFGDLDVLDARPGRGRGVEGLRQLLECAGVDPDRGADRAARRGREPRRAARGAGRVRRSAARQRRMSRNARSTAAQNLAAGTDGLFWGRGQLLVDDPAKVSRPPEDTEGHLLPQLARIGVQAAQRTADRLAVFRSGRRGRGLRWAPWCSTGVRVTVLTNSLAATDVGAVHAGYKRYREALLEAGVRLYELKPDAIEYARSQGQGKPGRSAVRALRCTPRPSCSTGAPCSSARSTSIRGRCS